ncbi:MAG: hypothetical protein EOP84_15590 [Verrucomicrobiaceae bacterium]|nr:MAG: hypothetical protein EOP84_15590 [Verrucomicrobiaceae bacterium]
MEPRVIYMGKCEQLNGTMLHFFEISDSTWYLEGDLTLQDRITNWCADQFGEPKHLQTWSCRAGMLMIVDDAVATLFRLQWC